MNNDSVADAMLVVVVNGQAVIEYDRRKPLAPRQQAYLDRMDQDMDHGFDRATPVTEAPDLLTRAQFVASNLLQALESQNDSIAAATCAYLANRLPDLKQVRADNKQNGEVQIDLVFDKTHVSSQVVQFVGSPGKDKLH